MSCYINQVPALRQLARVYRQMLVLAVPAVLAGCQGADSLAPDAISEAGDPSAPSAAPTTVEPAADLIPGISPRIVFSAITLNGSTDIWTMGSAGGSPTSLTSFAEIEFGASWSYNHKRIAYARLRGGAPDIFLVNGDGTNKRWARSTTYPGGPIDSPSWSPDGTHLLVRVMFQGAPRVAKLDLATENMTLLAPAGVFALEANDPIYDRTGKTIFYVDRTLKTIKRFTPGGGVTTVLTSTNYLGQLAISPDGTRLAYYSGVNGTNNSEIFVYNLVTKVAKRLTYNSASDGDPTWSPDGTKLVFNSSRTGKMQIWSMNSSTGGNLVQITNRTYGAYAPAWAN
jgi:TolB protein